MARHKLTDSKIRTLTKPGIYGDGDGLYLRVQSSGRRSWVFIWKRFGARREIGLGSYDAGTPSPRLAPRRKRRAKLSAPAETRKPISPSEKPLRPW